VWLKSSGDRREVTPGVRGQGQRGIRARAEVPPPLLQMPELVLKVPAAPVPGAEKVAVPEVSVLP